METNYDRKVKIMKPVYAYAFCGCSAFDRYHDDRFAIDLLIEQREIRI